MLKSSQAKYESEEVYPWDHYFGFSLRSHLEGRVALDLGCFTGGRSIAWAQRYGLRRISGVDVEPVYIEAATLFARLYDVPSEFRVGYGEKLPVEDDSFDAILSFDVLEHVRNVGKTLAECIVYFGLSAKCFSSSRATGIPMNIVWGSSLACPVSTGGLGETLW